MMTIRSLVASALLVAVSHGANAQEAQNPPPPTAEAKWLERFVGEWDSESTAAAAPGAEPSTCRGSISCKSLGGYWVVAEMKMNTPKPITGVLQIGYDPQAKKYIGAWIDSTSSTLWQYEGSVDASGSVLTLNAQGPSLTGDGKPALYRDQYDFSEPGRLKLTSLMQGADGRWVTYMTGLAERKEE